MNLYTIYDNCTNNIQNYINKNVATIPQEFVKSSVKGFAISFAATMIFAKENHLRAGLSSCAMSLCGMAIDAAIRKVIITISRKMTPDNEKKFLSSPIFIEMLSDVAKISFVSTLFLNHALNLQINKTASCALSLILYLSNVGKREKAPMFGIVAHG